MAGLKRRGKIYYAQYYVGQKQKRVGLGTSNYQIAKEKLRQIESGISRGEDNLLPTKTPIGQVVQAYIDHIKNVKSFRSHSKDINNLKRIFGACCSELVEACKKYPIGKSKIIEANCFEYITTAQISSDLRAYLDKYTPHPSSGNWYFPSTLSFSHYDADNLSTHLRKANKKAGLQWTCLDYRHTFGTMLAMKGESLYKISTLMGNSPEICKRHYAALIPETMADSVEFIISVTKDIKVI